MIVWILVLTFYTHNKIELKQSSWKECAFNGWSHLNDADLKEARCVGVKVDVPVHDDKISTILDRR